MSGAHTTSGTPAGGSKSSTLGVSNAHASISSSGGSYAPLAYQNHPGMRVNVNGYNNGSTATHKPPSAHQHQTSTMPDQYSPAGKQAAAMAHAASIAGDAQSAVGIWATRLARKPDDVYALKRRCEAALAVKRHVLAAEDAIKIANIEPDGEEGMQLVARVAGVLGWVDIKRTALARAAGENVSAEAYEPVAGGDAVGGALERLRKRLFDAALGTQDDNANSTAAATAKNAHPAVPQAPAPADASAAFPYGVPPTTVTPAAVSPAQPQRSVSKTDQPLDSSVDEEEDYDDDDDDESEYTYEDEEEEEDEEEYEEEEYDDEEEEADEDEDNEVEDSNSESEEEEAELANLERAVNEVERDERIAQEQQTSSSPPTLAASTTSATLNPTQSAPTSHDSLPTAPLPPPGVVPPAMPPPSVSAPPRRTEAATTSTAAAAATAAATTTATTTVMAHAASSSPPRVNKRTSPPKPIPSFASPPKPTPQPAPAPEAKPMSSSPEGRRRVSSTATTAEIPTPSDQTKVALWPSNSACLLLPQAVTHALTYLTELEELDNTPASSEMAGPAAEDARASLALAVRDLEKAHETSRGYVTECAAHFSNSGISLVPRNGTPAMRKLRENYHSTTVAYCRSLLAVGRAERCQVVLRMPTPVNEQNVSVGSSSESKSFLMRFFAFPEEEFSLLSAEIALFANSDGARLAASHSAAAISAIASLTSRQAFEWTSPEPWTAARRAAKVAKRTAAAAEYHAEGNECFRRRMWQAALDAYEKSLRVGVQVVRTMPPGRWASRVYANRSAAGARCAQQLMSHVGSDYDMQRDAAAKLAKGAYEDSTAAIAADGSNAKAQLRHACACHIMAGLGGMQSPRSPPGRRGASNHGSKLPSQSAQRMRAEAQRALDAAVRADSSLREEASKIALHRGLPPLQPLGAEASDPDVGGSTERSEYTPASSRPSTASASTRPTSARPTSARSAYANAARAQAEAEAQARAEAEAHAPPPRAESSYSSSRPSSTSSSRPYATGGSSTRSQQGSSPPSSKKFTRSHSTPTSAPNGGGLPLKLATEIDHYVVLGVEKSATTDEIKSAFRKRALLCHPDKVAAASAASGEETVSLVQKVKEKQVADLFRRLREARDVLTDASKRRDHDTFLQRRGVSGFPHYTTIRRPSPAAPTASAHSTASRPSAASTSAARGPSQPFGYGGAQPSARPKTPSAGGSRPSAAPPPSRPADPRGPAWSSTNRRPVSANDGRSTSAAGGAPTSKTAGDGSNAAGGGFFSRLFRARQA